MVTWLKVLKVAHSCFCRCVLRVKGIPPCVFAPVGRHTECEVTG